MIDYAAELNKAQLEAVNTLDGSVLLIAGAGSGKTRVLVYRVAHLVEKGIPPEQILLLTFTRKASQEMMRRAALVLDGRCNRVAGGTFHSFANSVLRRYARRCGIENNFTILDRDDAEGVINLVRQELGYDKSKDRFPKKSALMDVFSKTVNTGRAVKTILFEDYPNFGQYAEEISHLADRYGAFKKAKSLVDYDDLLVYLKDLLRDDEETRTRVSGQYRYIMVDEYQDTNRLQGHITALLASVHGNLLVVGDDAQSIYSFRGASFRNIMDFPKVFANTRVITMEQNYRSMQPILNLTNRIIANAKEKFSKELFTERAGDTRPVFVNITDEIAQAEFVCNRILALREEGVPLSEIAVLFRNSYHSNQLEVELGNRNIPFVKYGGLKFLEAAHVKDVVAFLKTVQNKNDEIAWRRLLGLIGGVGEATAAKIFAQIHADPQGYPALAGKELAGKKFSRDLVRLREIYAAVVGTGTPVPEIIRLFLPFYQPLLKEKYDNATGRLEDLDSLVSIAGNYESLELFLAQVTLEPPERGTVTPEEREEEKLVLSTIHSAKGLEWHSVFLLSLLDGYLPDKRSVEDPEAIEEERRLFYVAATRARDNLFLLKPTIVHGGYSFYGDGAFSGLLKPSRFLTEIPEFVDLVDTEEYGKYEAEGDGFEGRGGDDDDFTDDRLDRIRRYYR
ncbi:MAG: ATP-dependent helicase [Planctomycetota bacterium]